MLKSTRLTLMQDAGEWSPKYRFKKKKYPTNFNVYRLRNDLMQFNNNQECEFNTNLLCMLLLLSPPTPFYCKNCRKLSLHEHLVTNISPPVVRAACSRLQKKFGRYLKIHI